MHTLISAAARSIYKTAQNHIWYYIFDIYFIVRFALISGNLPHISMYYKIF